MQGNVNYFYLLFLYIPYIYWTMHCMTMSYWKRNEMCVVKSFFFLMMMHALKLDQSSLTLSKVSNPLWTFLSTTNEINFHMYSQIMHLNEHIKWHKILSHLLPKKVDYFPSCVHSKTWNYFISNRATNLVYIYIKINFPKITAKMNPITWYKMNMLFKDSLL